MKKTINYSGILALILIASLVFMPVSCSKEAVKVNSDADTSSQLIKVSGEDANAATKTTLSDLVTSWVITADKVGIYSPHARTAPSEGGSTIVNAQYTAASSGVSSNFTGTMYWGTAGATDHNFYAYYPYTAGSESRTAVPISLTTTQVQVAKNDNTHLGASVGALDFMIATPATVTSPGGTAEIVNTVVSLRYNHVFTVLEFQIAGTGTLQAVKLVGSTTPVAFSGGTIDITQEPPAAGTSYTFASQTGTTTQAVVTLTSAATLTANHTDTKVYMVINPGTQTSNCLIGLQIGGTWTYISKAAPVADGGFKRGKKYVVEIHTADATASPPVDYDGNVYNTVTIGTQTWMAENLKTTHYNDGTDISNVTDNTLWAALSTGAYCDYSNTSSNSTTYGRLYNWFAVDNNASTKAASNGGKNICPTGWHVPTVGDWNDLTTFLSSDAGNKLKETGTLHWQNPNTGATNQYGFTALPSGLRVTTGGFDHIGTTGLCWSSSFNGTEPTTEAWYRSMAYNASTVTANVAFKTYGLSVRCIKDAP